MESKSGSGGEKSSPGPGRSSARTGWLRQFVILRLVIATMLFGLSTWWALTRFNRPDPFNAPRVFSLAWWLHPLEVNAPARLPIVSGTLTSFAVGGNGDEIYAAGQQGMLLRYRRSTQVWERITVPDSLSAMVPATLMLSGKQN